jgi:hypothetical protein
MAPLNASRRTEFRNVLVALLRRVPQSGVQLRPS